jgi:hypothetical protein
MGIPDGENREEPMTVIDWAARLSCSSCGARDAGCALIIQA